jgi:hypothetical protein
MIEWGEMAVHLPTRAGLDFSDYSIFSNCHAWLLEEKESMYRFVRSLRASWWYALLGGAVLLTLGGCGSAAPPAPPEVKGDGQTPLATTTPNPTPASIPGWPTYSDNIYSFAIQYPQDWTSLLEPQQQGASYEVVGFFATGSPLNNVAPTQDVITITAEQVQPDTSDSGAPPGFAPSGSINVGGTNQTLLSGPGSTGGQGLLVMAAWDDRVFIFYSTADNASAALFQQTLTQMLSTFHVTPRG